MIVIGSAVTSGEVQAHEARGSMNELRARR
jgi:hypothetical protein